MGDDEGGDPGRGGPLTVFVDTAVIMYAGGRDHPLRQPSQGILRLIASGELEGATSAEVIQEILHRFTAIAQRRPGGQMARHALDLFAPVLPITHAVMQRMPGLVERYRQLHARDLIHVATCIEEGIGAIVSPDRGFDDVGEITRLAPEDSQAISRYLR